MADQEQTINKKRNLYTNITASKAVKKPWVILRAGTEEWGMVRDELSNQLESYVKLPKDIEKAPVSLLKRYHKIAIERERDFLKSLGYKNSYVETKKADNAEIFTALYNSKKYFKDVTNNKGQTGLSLNLKAATINQCVKNALTLTLNNFPKDKDELIKLFENYFYKEFTKAYGGSNSNNYTATGILNTLALLYNDPEGFKASFSTIENAEALLKKYQKGKKAPFSMYGKSKNQYSKTGYSLEMLGLTFDLDSISEIAGDILKDAIVETRMTGTDQRKSTAQKQKLKVISKKGEISIIDQSEVDVSQKADIEHIIAIGNRITHLKVTDKFRSLFTRSTFEFQNSSVNRTVPQLIEGMDLPGGRKEALANRIMFSAINTTHGAIFSGRRDLIQTFLSRMMLNTIIDIKDLDNTTDTNIIWLINLNKTYYPLSSLIDAMLAVDNFIRIGIHGSAEEYHNRMRRTDGISAKAMEERFNILGDTMLKEATITPYITNHDVRNLMAKNA